MREIIKKILKEEKGSVVILVTLFMIVLLGMMALVVDVGMAYAERTKLQNVVDAAALAGVQNLPQEHQARSMATFYAERNGVPVEDLVIEISADKKSIQVSARKLLISFFARVLTNETGYVGAQAVARSGVISAIGGLAPLAIEEDEFAYGQLVELKFGAGGSTGGNFGPLDLGEKGGGASDYREYLKKGYEGVLAVGDKVWTETGNMSGPTKKAIEYRFEAICCCDIGSFDFSSSCPRILIVPMYAGNISSGKTQITITGFAAFHVEEIPGSGNKSIIRGRFAQMITEGRVSAQATCFGLGGVQLSK